MLREDTGLALMAKLNAIVQIPGGRPNPLIPSGVYRVLEVRKPLRNAPLDELNTVVSTRAASLPLSRAAGPIHLFPAEGIVFWRFASLWGAPRWMS